MLTLDPVTLRVDVPSRRTSSNHFVHSFIPHRNDSSGFEHVFVGETRRTKEVIGFHNWIQFYLQEKRGNVDYMGHHARRWKNQVGLDTHPIILDRSSQKGLFIADPNSP